MWYDDHMSDDYLTPSPRRIAGNGSAGAEPIARRKLSREVLDRLLSRIRAGEFPAGTWLPSERELMQAYGVGRPAVREALQSLERMGLLAIVHGEGARAELLTQIEGRGSRIEDRGSRIEDRGSGAMRSRFLNDPRSSIFDLRFSPTSAAP